MSAKVKVMGKLPGGEEWNGLDHYAKDIQEAMRAGSAMMLGCWVVFDTPEGVLNMDDGSLTPKLRIRQAEVITTDGSLPEGDFRRTVEEAFFERTGKQPLPLDEAEGGAVIEGDFGGE